MLTSKSGCQSAFQLSPLKIQKILIWQNAEIPSIFRKQFPDLIPADSVSDGTHESELSHENIHENINDEISIRIHKTIRKNGVYGHIDDKCLRQEYGAG